MQTEQPGDCPECGRLVPYGRLGTHLRQAHHIYQFGGKRRSRAETLAVLWGAVQRADPDLEAWHTLEAIAIEERGAGAEAFLAECLARELRATGAESAAKLIAGLAGAITAGSRAERLARMLTTSAERAARQLALAIAARVPNRMGKKLVKSLRPLLRDRRLPEALQLSAAAAMLRSTGNTGPAASRTLESLAAGRGKQRAIDRLRRLEKLVGSLPALDDLCRRLEDRLRMACPRCGALRRRRSMERHLWERHGLVLDGRRARKPWLLIHDWIKHYQRQDDPALLERCRALAQRVDPEHGLARLRRLFAVEEVGTAGSRQALLAEARQAGASLCPHCYAQVSIPESAPLRELNVWRGRLSAGGYRVEVSEAGLFSQLEILTPAGMLYRGREPGGGLTGRGAVLVLTGPLVLAALAMAVALPAPFRLVPPLLPVVLLLLAAVVVYAVARLRRRDSAPALDRAVDHAWQRLAPRLHAADFSLDDSAFLAGLALTSIGHGQPAARQPNLARTVSLTAKAVGSGVKAARHLAGLERLAIEDAAAAGQDPVPLTTEQVGRCFEGKLPLTFAEGLLADWVSDWWTRGNRARLRVLLCDRAFEAGLELTDLVECGHLAPALASVLDTADLNGLARLRLLWSLRPRRPWDRCGEALTAFEVAGPADSRKRLGQYPDLLLVQEIPPPRWAAPEMAERRPWAEVVVCGRGIAFQNTLFEEPPRSVEVLLRAPEDGGGSELLLDGQRFSFMTDPEPLAARLERWFRWYFGEFVPRLAEVRSWRSPAVAATLHALEAVSCPECDRVLLPRIGEIGLALNDTAPGGTHSRGRGK
jgi:hypothetical protein